jgi:hypothetical protein
MNTSDKKVEKVVPNPLFDDDRELAPEWNGLFFERISIPKYTGYHTPDYF